MSRVCTVERPTSPREPGSYREERRSIGGTNWQTESTRVRARVQQKIEALKEYAAKISTPAITTKVRGWPQEE